MNNIPLKINMIIRKIITVLLVFVMLITYARFFTIGAKGAGETSGKPTPNGGYGITFVKLEDFKYYEEEDTYKNSEGTYHWYGTGLEFDFALPQEAKKGDYFTLKLPDELILSNLPMFEESDNVDYKNLDNVPNKYGKKGMQKTNVFFSVYSKEKTNSPKEKLLDVYYTKRNELTFVCTENVDNKGAIKGSGIIGNPVNLENLRAFTDMHSRHYKTGFKSAGNQSLRDWKDVKDEEHIGDKFSKEKYGYLYEGIRPNVFLLSPANGSTPGQNGIVAANSKEIKFKTKYGEDSKEFSLYSTANINYHTELYKSWLSGGVWRSHGNQSLQVIQEDRDYIYFAMSFNANNGKAINGQEEFYYRHGELMGGNLIPGDFMVDTALFGDRIPFLALDFDTIKIYKGSRQGKLSQSMTDVDAKNPYKLPPIPNVDHGTQTYNGVSFKREILQSSDRAKDILIIDFPANGFGQVFEPSYYITFRARKNITNKRNNGKPLMRMDMKGYGGGKGISETYARTTGFTIGDADIKPVDYVASPSLKLFKADDNGNVIKDQAGKVAFKATDITYGEEQSHINFVKEIDDKGEVVFPSLLNGHTYILEETKVDDSLPYKLSKDKFIINVDNEGKIKISNKDGSPITDKTKPISTYKLDDKNFLTFKFSNKPKYSFKIKKVNSSGNVISGDKAEFELKLFDNSKPIVTKPIVTEYNNRFGESEEVGISPTTGEQVYELRETKAPNGYKALENPIQFTVDNYGKITPRETNQKISVSKENDVSVMSVKNETLTKVIIDKYEDGDKNKKLSGVEFELLDVSKKSIKPKKETGTTEKNKTIEVTNVNGQAVFDGLNKNTTYYIKETKALTGYKLPKNEYYKVVVNKNYEVTVTKVDENDKEIKDKEDSSRTVFRSANYEDRIADTPNQLYENVGTTSFEGVTAKQTIEPTIEPTKIQGKYKVNVELNGINNFGSDYVFIIEESYWMDPSPNFKEVIKNAFNKIKEKDPDARVSVVIEIPDSSQEVISLKDVDEALKEVDSKIRTAYNVSNGAREFGTSLNKATEILGRNNFNSRNKHIIQFLSTGMGSREAGYIGNQISSAGKIIRDNNIVHDILYLGTYRDPKDYYTWANVQILENNNLTGDSNNKINSIVESTKVGPGEINIQLNTDVAKFDGFDGTPPNAIQNGGNIIVSKISSRPKDATSRPKDATSNYSFSYFIRSNPNAELDVLKEIATNAKYKLYSKPEVVMDMPKPKLAMPSITVSVDREYKNIVPNEYKKQTNIKIEATENPNGIDNKKLSDIKELNTDKVIFKKLPKFDLNGNDFIYQITETGLAEILSSTIEPNQVVGVDKDVHIITNLRNLNITVTKNGNGESSLKKVKLIGYANNEPVNLEDLGVKPIIKKFENENTPVIFKDLPRLTKDGSIITYSVKGLDDNGRELDSNKYRVEYTYGKAQNGIDDSYIITNNGYTVIPIANKKIDPKYPDAGGIGSIIFYLMGIVLMGYSGWRLNILRYIL